LDKNALVAIAQGSEEMEAVVVIDILRRAGINVKVAGETEIITCSNGLKILPDVVLQHIDDDVFFDIVVLPGGSEGVNRLSLNDYMIKILNRHFEKKKLIAAICAAPLLLSDYKMIDSSVRLTSHPSIKEHLAKYDYSEDNVVVDGNLITSRGAGTALDFALTIVEFLGGEELAKSVSKSIVYDWGK